MISTSEISVIPVVQLLWIRVESIFTLLFFPSVCNASGSVFWEESALVLSCVVPPPLPLSLSGFNGPIVPSVLALCLVWSVGKKFLCPPGFILSLTALTFYPGALWVEQLLLLPAHLTALEAAGTNCRLSYSPPNICSHTAVPASPHASTFLGWVESQILQTLHL